MRTLGHTTTLAALTTMLAAGVAHANIIVNGSFELPLTATTAIIPQNSAALIGWTVDADNVKVYKENVNGSIIGSAQDGSQFLDIIGTQPGTIRQTFPTIPGQEYTLSFYFSNNYAQTNLARAVVGILSGTDTVLDAIFFEHSGASANNLNWTLFTDNFVATSITSELSFISEFNIPSDQDGGILLDNVSVERAVPTPSAVSLFALAGAPLLCRRRS